MGSIYHQTCTDDVSKCGSATGEGLQSETAGGEYPLTHLGEVISTLSWVLWTQVLVFLLCGSSAMGPSARQVELIRRFAMKVLP